MDRRKITVVTSCTGVKASLSPGATLPAEDLYRGQQQLRLMRGVRRLRTSGAFVDVWIVSAGHGLVHGSEQLARYERTFQGRTAEERRLLAEGLGIPSAAQAVLETPADLALVALGEDYLDACRLKQDVQLGAPTVVLAGASATLALPSIPGLLTVPLRLEHTRQFSCGLVALKGEIGGRLLASLADRPNSIERLLAENPLDSLAFGVHPAEPLRAPESRI